MSDFEDKTSLLPPRGQSSAPDGSDGPPASGELKEVLLAMDSDDARSDTSPADERSAGSPDEPENGSKTKPPRKADFAMTLDFVRKHCRGYTITVHFDETMVRDVDEEATDLVSRVAREPIDAQWLEDAIWLEPEAVELKASYVKRAVRRFIKEEKRQRLSDIAMRLYRPLEGEEAVRASEHWRRLGECFEGDLGLNIAKFEQFCWLVKRKVAKLPVKRHLMLIFVSQKQGVGKSEFTDSFCEPWKEAATPLLISDVVDPRSGDIFDYPIGKIDDIPPGMPDKAVSLLKDVITAKRVKRRRMGSNSAFGKVQTLTFIGSANHDVPELFIDETGHRRFAVLTFKPIDPTDNDNPIWSALRSIDYEVLWRSVDHDGPPPIEPFLGALGDEQRRGSTKTDLLAWLQQLRVDSPEFMAITTQKGKAMVAGATGLYELFLSDTGSTMSMKSFAEKMRVYVLREDVPIGQKFKVSESMVYRVK